MTRVLAFATVAPRISALGPYATEIVAAGGEVRLACWFDPGVIPADTDLVEARMVGGSTPQAGAARHGTQTWWRRKLGAGHAAAASAADPVSKRWLGVKADPWVTGQVAVSDYLVALDQDAVHPVWEFAHAHPGVRASFGLYAVIADLAGRLSLTDGR